MEAELGVRDIVSRTMALIERNMGTALLALLALTASSIAIDFSSDAFSFVPILASLPIYLVAQYVLTRRALAGEGMPFANRSGLGSSFCGTSLVTSLVSALALLLLIVPGVYLFLRWSISIPAVLAEGKRIDDAMATSRERTRDNLVPIGLAHLIVNVPWILGIWLSFRGFPGAETLTLPASVLMNTLVSSGYIASWLCMVATYGLLQPTRDLEEVFA